MDNALKMIKSFDEVNKPGCLQEGFWSDNDVFNALNDDPAKLAIVLNKEGENGKPLAGQGLNYISNLMIGNCNCSRRSQEQMAASYSKIRVLRVPCMWEALTIYRKLKPHLAMF